jgi:DNA-binding IclR family transcriptional regulator
MDQFQENKSLGISDLAKKTNMFPSDVHRLLTSLRAFGYVDQDPETRKYRLGFSLIRLGALQWDRLCEKAHPPLVRLSQQIAAPTWLALLDSRETKLFLVDYVRGPNDLGFGHRGGPEPLHCTALGKTIIANLNQDIAVSALDKSGLTRYTRDTITDRSLLLHEFHQIRRLGYAVDREEYVNGVCCLASPLRSGAGRIIGAISAAMPSSRFLEWNESRLGAQLKTAALHISSSL